MSANRSLIRFHVMKYEDLTAEDKDRLIDEWHDAKSILKQQHEFRKLRAIWCFDCELKRIKDDIVGATYPLTYFYTCPNCNSKESYCGDF